jgi:hypothetical protein
LVLAAVFSGVLTWAARLVTRRMRARKARRPPEDDA